jgi:hypothetical protein
MEAGLVRAGMIQGWEALLRPGVLIIAAIGLVALGASLAGRTRRETSGRVENSWRPAKGLPLALLILAPVLLFAVFGLGDAPATARVLPAGAGMVAVAAAALLAWRLRRFAASGREPEAASDWPLLGLLGAMLAAVPLAGPAAAAGLFCAAALLWRSRTPWLAALATGLVCAIAVYGLESLVR